MMLESEPKDLFSTSLMIMLSREGLLYPRPNQLMVVLMAFVSSSVMKVQERARTRHQPFMMSHGI